MRVRTLRPILLSAALAALLFSFLPSASARPSAESAYIVVLKDSVTDPARSPKSTAAIRAPASSEYGALR